MIDFLSIVLLVFGVLQIILFFKVWGMTNNVQKIKEQLCAAENDFQKLMLLGEKEKAFLLVKEKLVKRLSKSMSDIGARDKFVYVANEYIPIYAKKAALTGSELPEHLQTAEAFWDYFHEASNL